MNKECYSLAHQYVPSQLITPARFYGTVDPAVQGTETPDHRVCNARTKSQTSVTATTNERCKCARACVCARARACVLVNIHVALQAWSLDLGISFKTTATCLSSPSAKRAGSGLIYTIPCTTGLLPTAGSGKSAWAGSSGHLQRHSGKKRSTEEERLTCSQSSYIHTYIHKYLYRD